MDEILFSPKQYRALLTLLSRIRDDIALLKLKSSPKTEYLDNTDLMQLLQVTPRTLQRWRKIGRLPFTAIGKKYYYRPEDILENFELDKEGLNLETHTPPGMLDGQPDPDQIDCRYCPIFRLLIS